MIRNFKGRSGEELCNIINDFGKKVNIISISYSVSAINNGIDISMLHYALVLYKQKRK